MKRSNGQTNFRPPTPAEVAEYAASIGYGLDAGQFCDYWAARGWEVRPRIGMKDWKAAVRNWRRQEKAWAAEKGQPGKPGTAEVAEARRKAGEQVARQLLNEMLFWVKLSRQRDEEGRERHAEAMGKIRETAGRAKRLGGAAAVQALRGMVKERLG